MLVLNHKLILLAFLVLALFLAAADSVDAKKQCNAKGRHHKHHHKRPHKQSSSSASPTAPKPTSNQDATGPSSSSSASSGSSSSSGSGSGSSSSSTSDDSTLSSSSSLASLSSGSSISISGFTPPKGKAGVAGGNSLKWIANSLGWYYDWTPNPDNQNGDNILAVPMLWGLGRVDHDDDWARFEAFKKLKPGSAPFVMGFNEPDFSGSGSSGKISPQDAAAAWDQYLGPHAKAGAKLISPSMAMQKDETWMAPFLEAVKTQPDIIAVHIFQDNMDGVKGVLDHYAQYGKPMWITEFACINYQGPSPVYCDQSKVDSMLWQMVQLFESDSRVAAYSVSDANNGPYGDLTPNQAGQSLSATGKSYLASVQQADKKSRRDGLIPVRR
ncbi:uncharacterized protein SPSC_03065 [Sporisorium scitamineum]|uniref:Asl1-like glycosyl hydrolase catalytic domain-containing protein n=1 Tax=Sporisorium scitamineum TaxID=49012 RepID=A0A0F7RY59_9BASI|nr:hypothetical protein [Sporisorium scitamineum]CDS82245.1 uncharacterized protein SPSC_03065 [Sporisorium scitamineum]